MVGGVKGGEAGRGGAQVGLRGSRMFSGDGSFTFSTYAHC